MDIFDFIISKNCSSFNDIREHLERSDGLFNPILSSYINIDTYSKKLFDKSKRYEIFLENKLIGLVAVYFSVDLGYISNFSVEKEFVGKGLSSELMKFCIDDFKKENIGIIRLEVFKENERAINFYSKYGFKIENVAPTKLTLKKIL